MKIHAVFCAHDGPGNYAGGPNAWLQRLLPDLRDSSISVTSLVIGRGPKQECPLVLELQRNELPVHFLDLNRVEPQYLQQKIRWIVKKINELQPDIFVPNLVIPAYFAAHWVRQAGIPSIGVVHSNDAFYHQLLKTFVFGSRRWRINAVVAVSEYLEATIAHNNQHEVLLERIPYGVPIPQVGRRSESRGLRIAYVGRFRQEQKRILEVTMSFCEASKRLPNATFTFLGNGPEKAEMDKIIDSQGAQRTVLLRDPMPSALIQEFMQSQDVFVLLSDYEGLPIALQEAMATGTVPVCLSEASGINEIIEHGKNGIVVGNRGEAFISALCDLDGDRDLLKKLSLRARETIRTNYASQPEHKKWALLIKRLAAQPTRRKIRLPLLLGLPAVHPSFRGEDELAPPVLSRIRASFRKWVTHVRLTIRPRTRLRAVWQTLKDNGFPH